MFSLFNKKSIDAKMKKDLFDFLAELEKNLELFYVMDQRQFITNGFLTDVWSRVKEMDLIKKHETVIQYARAVQNFNLGLKAHKDYEAWYVGDVNNKNPENARKLHALKNDLDLKLKDLEALIILAGQDVEREMLKLGLLKA